jgi:hypothetical protein
VFQAAAGLLGDSSSTNGVTYLEKPAHAGLNGLEEIFAGGQQQPALLLLLRQVFCEVCRCWLGVSSAAAAVAVAAEGVQPACGANGAF